LGRSSRKLTRAKLTHARPRLRRHLANYDGDWPDCEDDDDCGCAGTEVVGAELDGGWP